MKGLKIWFITFQGPASSRPCAEALFNYDGKDPGYVLYVIYIKISGCQVRRSNRDTLGIIFNISSIKHKL